MTARARLARFSAWALAGALVVLAARALAYALAPQPTLLSLKLERGVGGPRLVVVGTIAFAVCGALATALLWLAIVAVRERRLAAGTTMPPRIGLLRVLGRAIGLWLACSLAFATLESYLHWREGLGFHGLHCLVGPVHRDALPILGALSLLAAAAVSALEHVIRWLRRVVAVLSAGRRPPAACPLLLGALPGIFVHGAPLWSAARPRAPPPLQV